MDEKKESEMLWAFIDEPSPYGPDALENWKQYLKRIEAFPRTEDTEATIEDAKWMISWIWTRSNRPAEESRAMLVRRYEEGMRRPIGERRR
jgi:hypothetical protein